MKNSRLSTMLAVLAILGLLPPTPGIASSPTGQTGTSPASDPATGGAKEGKTVRDIVLGENGELTGTVVSSSGSVHAGQTVSIRKDGREIASTKSDRDGGFRVAGLRGGVYEIHCGATAIQARLWVNDTAPPAATRAALIVSDANVTRGQRPLWMLANDPVIIGAIAAAAIAIPVIIHNSREDDNSSS